MENRIVPGCVIIYTLKKDEHEIEYINDGANRTIHALVDFERYCRKNKLVFKDILQDCSITEQSLIYDDLTEAIDHYASLQIGTMATPFEVFTCRFITSLENYERDWEPLFGKSKPVGSDSEADADDISDVDINSHKISDAGPNAKGEHKGYLHACVEDQLKSLHCKPRQKRAEVHKTYRDNLSLFVRFVSGDKSRWSPAVASSTLNPTALQDPETLEIKAADLFNELGHQEVKKQLKKFQSFLAEKKALFKQVWCQEEHPIVAPAETAVRWWLTLSIWHKNNNYDPESLKVFTQKWLSKYHGKTTMIYTSKAGIETNTNTQLSKITSLGQVMQACDYTLDEFCKEPEKRKKGLDLEDGFVNSHLLAHAFHGEGETIPENAIDNRCRGNRDMTEKEVNECKKLAKP